MDFLKALDEAKKQGLTKEEFVKIWECEMRLKQQREDYRTQDLRQASGNNGIAQGAESHTDSLQLQYLKEIHQTVHDLKGEVMLQNQLYLQDIRKQLDNISAILTMMLRGELPGAINQPCFGTNMDEFLQSIMRMQGGMGNSYADSMNSESCSEVQNSLGQQQKMIKEASVSQWCLSADQYPGYDRGIPFLPEDGAELVIKNVKTASSSKKVWKSSFYYLRECPSKVRLSVSFTETGKINAQLSIFGVFNQSFKTSRSFTVTGFVKNKGSESYSPLFEGLREPLRKVRIKKEMLVNTSVCLKTSSGSQEDVTYTVLNDKGFVINKALYIKWKVVSTEYDQTKDIYA